MTDINIYLNKKCFSLIAKNKSLSFESVIRENYCTSVIKHKLFLLPNSFVKTEEMD